MIVQIFKQQNVAVHVHRTLRSQSHVPFIPSPRRCVSIASARRRTDVRKVSLLVSKTLRRYSTHVSNISLETTRPAELVLPENDPNLSKFQFYFRTGKAYVSFYWKGIKNVWANYKTARAIQSRMGSRNIKRINDIVRKGDKVISFAEYEMLLRSRYDLKKLLPFGLVFAICGEFTPLVVLALGSRVVPATCRIPKQRDDDLRKLLKKDEQAINLCAEIIANKPLGSLKPDIEVDVLDDPEVLHLLGYSLSLTPFLKPLSVPGIADLYVNMVLKPRLQSHYETIFVTTLLIQREGGFSNPQLGTPEYWEWGMKYGLYRLRETARSGLDAGANELQMMSDSNYTIFPNPIYEEEAEWIISEVFAARKDLAQKGDTDGTNDWKVLARAQANAFRLNLKGSEDLFVTPDGTGRRYAVMMACQKIREQARKLRE